MLMLRSSPDAPRPMSTSAAAAQGSPLVNDFLRINTMNVYILSDTQLAWYAGETDGVCVVVLNEQHDRHSVTSSGGPALHLIESSSETAAPAQE